MELDFSIDVIEKLLLKKALNDKNWLNILSKVYDKRWFKDQVLSQILKNMILFYNKYDTIPNIKTINALSKKFIEKHPEQTNFTLAASQQLLAEVSSLNLNLPDDIINKNIKDYIRRNAFYNSLYDNANNIQ